MLVNRACVASLCSQFGFCLYPMWNRIVSSLSIFKPFFELISSFNLSNNFFNTKWKFRFDDVYGDLSSFMPAYYARLIRKLCQQVNDNLELLVVLSVPVKFNERVHQVRCPALKKPTNIWATCINSDTRTQQKCQKIYKPLKSLPKFNSMSLSACSSCVESSWNAWLITFMHSANVSWSVIQFCFFYNILSCLFVLAKSSSLLFVLFFVFGTPIIHMYICLNAFYIFIR